MSDKFEALLICINLLAILFMWYDSPSLMYRNTRIRYVTFNGIYVGWTEPDYVVNEYYFDKILREYLVKAEKNFPGASRALEGTYVIFREPTWFYDGRYVKGLQSYDVIHVGWKKNLERTALTHELGHRIIQQLKRDPPEHIAHEMLEKAGLL